MVCSIYRTDDEGVGYRDEILHGYCKGDIWYEFYFREDCSIGIDNVSKIKPYLFPLSSMTQEQQKEANVFDDMDIKILSKNLGENYRNKTNIPTPTYNYIDWLIENHFDYRGLIPKGLAIDATGKNIYMDLPDTYE